MRNIGGIRMLSRNFTAHRNDRIEDDSDNWWPGSRGGGQKTKASNGRHRRLRDSGVTVTRAETD